MSDDLDSQEAEDLVADSKAVAPQELYNTTSKTLPDALRSIPEYYSEVESSPQLGILGPPLPGDIGAGLYGKPKDIPTDNPFRYQPPSSYAPALSQSYELMFLPVVLSADHYCVY